MKNKGVVDGEEGQRREVSVLHELTDALTGGVLLVLLPFNVEFLLQLFALLLQRLNSVGIVLADDQVVGIELSHLREHLAVFHQPKNQPGESGAEEDAAVGGAVFARHRQNIGHTLAAAVHFQQSRRDVQIDALNAVLVDGLAQSPDLKEMETVFYLQ